MNGKQEDFKNRPIENMMRNIWSYFFALALMVICSNANAADYAGTRISADASVSTATYCGIIVSSITATRVDNYNNLCESTMTARTGIRIVIPSAGSNMVCGYSSLVSSITSNSRYGEEYVAGSKTNVPIRAAVPYFCISTGSVTSLSINVQQTGQ